MQGLAGSERASLLFVEFRPGIPESHGSVEYRFSRLRVCVDTKIPDPLELELIAGSGFREGGFCKHGFYLKRVGINVIHEGFAFFRIVGVLS